MLLSKSCYELVKIQHQDPFPNYGTDYDKEGYLDFLKIKPGGWKFPAANLFMVTQHHDTPVRPRCGIG